jgi:hypothetical protein
MSGQIYANKDIACVHCKIPFPKRMAMANSRGGTLSKGMIMVCSACGGAQVLGDSDWRPMTKRDFDVLPPKSKADLLTVVQGLKKRLETGKEWSPYGDHLVKGN